MSVNIPSSFDFGIDLGVDVSGLPTDYTIKTNVAPLTLNLGPIQIQPLELKPVDISLRLKEIPTVRVHLPLDYCVGLSVLGSELLTLRLCGQGQIITEPYVANPCESRATPQRPDLATLERLAAKGVTGG
jgi:hypothetical protein